MTQYSQEELRKLFEGLPDNLKDAVLSEATANAISDICQRYGIEGEKVPRLAGLVGNVLMGILSPKELPETLKGELVIDRETAQKISQEINRFILYPVKESLVEFYKVELAPGGRLVESGVKEKVISKKTPSPLSPKEKKSSRGDIYREPIK